MTACTSATAAVTWWGRFRFPYPAPNRGRYLTADKQCVVARSCPQSTFADAISQSCKKCYQVNAATCTDASATGSTSCLTGSCLSGDKCVYSNRMQAGFYCPNGVMASCGDGVSKCDASGAATGCKTGFNIGADGTTADQTWNAATKVCEVACKDNVAADGSCVKCIGDQTWNTDSKKCDSPACRAAAQVSFDRNTENYNLDARAQYLDEATQTCKNCNDQYAQTCDGAGKATACLYNQFRVGLSTFGTCLSCDALANRYYDSQSRTCALYCPTARFDWSTGIITTPAKYLDAANDVCLDCKGAGALRCDSNGVTQDCIPGWNLDLSGTTCIQCDADKQFDYTSKTCKSRCTLMAKYSADSNGNFQYIQQRAQRFNADTKQCVNCNDQYALSCSTAGKTDSCIQPYNLDATGTCVRCADGEVWEASSLTCKSSCANADAQYTLDAGGRATNIIDWAHYYHILYQICYSCRDKYAQRCNYNGYSTSCVPGATMDGSGHCQMVLPTCSDKFTFNIERNRCEPNCGPAQYSNPSNPDRTSAAPDIRATYYDVNTNSCTACTDPWAYSCPTDGLAERCAPPKYRSDAGTCIDESECPGYARASMIAPAAALAGGFPDEFRACAISFFGF
ncbi:hypothetical protein JCM10450v2_003429 [Rhodotorula kratochvilovae]